MRGDGEEIDCPSCGAPVMRVQSRSGKPMLVSKHPEVEGTINTTADGFAFDLRGRKLQDAKNAGMELHRGHVCRTVRR